jgi:hypothetical protein
MDHVRTFYVFSHPLVGGLKCRRPRLFSFRFGSLRFIFAAPQVDDACPLAALAALCFDADQAKKMEWYNAYPNVPRTPSERAIRRARAFPPPQLDSGSDTTTTTGAFGLLKNLNAKEFSTFSTIVHRAVGSDQAVMTAIANIAKREIDWQLSLMQPMFLVPLRHPHPTGDGNDGAVTITSTVAAVSAARVQRDLPLPPPRRGKRKRSPAHAPGSPTPPERKRTKIAIAAGPAKCDYRVVPGRSTRSSPSPRAQAEQPTGGRRNSTGGSGSLWERLGGDPTPSPRTTTMTCSGTRGASGRGGGRPVPVVRAASSGYLLRPRRHPETK